MSSIPAGPPVRKRPSPRRWRGLLRTVALTVLLAACSTGGGDPFTGGGSLSDEIELLVDNRHFSQVTVYTFRTGVDRRIGIVQGKNEATFKFRWTFPDIALRVKFLAGPDFVTDSQPVGPGEILELIIPAR